MDRQDTMFDQNIIDRHADEGAPAPKVDSADEIEGSVGAQAAAETQKKRDAKEGGLSDDEALQEALEGSMDASDAPSITQPGKNDPAPSSGFPPELEKEVNGE